MASSVRGSRCCGSTPDASRLFLPTLLFECVLNELHGLLTIAYSAASKLQRRLAVKVLCFRIGVRSQQDLDRVHSSLLGRDAKRCVAALSRTFHVGSGLKQDRYQFGVAGIRGVVQGSTSVAV